jgi:hypothetical protein
MEKHSYYHELQGQYVIVLTKSTSFLGLLEKDSLDTITLRPSLINEPLFAIANGEIKTTNGYRLETQRPLIINTMDVQAVEPTTKEHLEDMINVSNAFKILNANKNSENK